MPEIKFSKDANGNHVADFGNIENIILNRITDLRSYDISHNEEVTTHTMEFLKGGRCNFSFNNQTGAFLGGSFGALQVMMNHGNELTLNIEPKST